MEKNNQSSNSPVNLVDECPENFEDCLALAEAQLEACDYRLACFYFERAILINPTCSSTHNELGLALEQEGRISEAMRSYKAGLLVDPRFAEAHNNIGNLLHAEGNLEGALKSYKKALKYDSLLAPAYNNIGNVKLELGQTKSAKKNFQRALELDSKMTEAYINLGNLFKDSGEVKEAVRYYKKALRLDPDDLTTQHNLNAILGKTTERAPTQYVKEVFDDYAARFESHLVDELGYKMPLILRETVDSWSREQQFQQGLDIGCGTGICGEVFSDAVNLMVGIDVSEKMLQKSEEKKIYKELVLGEINEVLAKRKDSFDFFVSADVFIYLGDLNEVFKNVRKCSREKGIFVFSTEHIEAESYVLLPSGRYAHPQNYIDRLLDQYGFNKLSFSIQGIRREEGKWIKGGVYLAEL